MSGAPFADPARRSLIAVAGLGLAYALYALNGSRGAGVVVLVAAAQTARRDAIGKTQLADMLEGRDKMSTELQRIIDHRTEPWEINVVSGDPRESDRQVAEEFREAPAPVVAPDVSTPVALGDVGLAYVDGGGRLLAIAPSDLRASGASF
jgi:hypothetical protein